MPKNYKNHLSCEGFKEGERQLKKNFITEMHVQNQFYVYRDYEFQGGAYFSDNDMNAIIYEGFAAKKIFPLTDDLFIKDLFFKGQHYGENQEGGIERIEQKKELNKYQNNAAYIVAKDAITTLRKEEYIEKLLFQKKRVSSDFKLDSFGKTLYTELGKWDFNSFQQIISFCETWGLPTGVTISDLEKKTPEIDINIIWMSLEDFYTKIYEYQRIFSYFKALNTNDFSKLPTTPKKGEQIKVHALKMFDREIEEKSLFHFKMQDRTPISVFKDLFEAAYFYLTLSRNISAEMRTCEYCGHLFEVTHQRQRFCSVLPGRKRSSCEMAFNNRLKKEKKLIQRGEK